MVGSVKSGCFAAEEDGDYGSWLSIVGKRDVSAELGDESAKSLTARVAVRRGENPEPGFGGGGDRGW